MKKIVTRTVEMILDEENILRVKPIDGAEMEFADAEDNLLAIIKLTGDKASDGSDYEKDYAKFIGLPVAIVAPARCKGQLMGFSNVLFPCFPSMKLAFKWLKKEIR